MRDRAIILLHGMGDHTAKSFKQEVIEGTQNALKRYPSYETVNIEENVDLIPIGFDHIFEERRQALKDAGDNLTDYLNKIPGVPDVASTITRIQSGLGDDKFEYTHVMDVLLYLSLVGEQVRYYVADEIEKVFLKYGSDKVSILAHSLGTAVLHDTLQKLYTTGISGERDIKLNVSEFNIESIWMFANVSPIITKLSGFPGPTQSLVKPGAGGCTQIFVNTFNSWDPFTLEKINRFNPPDDGSWINSNIYQLYYRRLITTDISRLNTHSIIGYLEDPVVCHFFLDFFLKNKFSMSVAEKKQGDDAFVSIEDDAQEIRDFALKVGDKKDVVDLLKMSKDFYDLLKSMGEAF